MKPEELQRRLAARRARRLESKARISKPRWFEDAISKLNEEGLRRLDKALPHLARRALLKSIEGGKRKQHTPTEEL
jgi:hypothetical protein